MKTIKLTEGCFGSHIYIDDESIEDTDTNILKEICTSVINKTDDTQLITAILEHIVSYKGTYHPDSDPCDECGTWGAQYILKV